ncbi:MAG TPA: NAD-dependent malic enzyme [Streptosporangiaceae bacterium]|nr:NAD-dependent malic enzyme [Streptosporangiaceae bacterium]
MTGLTGTEILGQPLLNKDAAFTQRERDALGLRGLLPWRVATIDEQMALELEHLRNKTDDMEKYIGLTALQDRNETLFYRLLGDHLEEFAPIVYTPTVGDACRQFSHILRRPRGLWITPDDITRIPELLRNAGKPDVRLIVVTDNERILGLGDQGAGGMGIPVGKLALYTAGAGIEPHLTLPVSLDCGTDNEDLLRDPLYFGYPKPRLRGLGYDEFIDAFVHAVHDVFPEAVLQWEDFKQHNAIRLLDRYRTTLPSFNDDIQGTAAVVLAGILAAVRARGEPVSAQRLVFLGAGAAGLGIARLVSQVMLAEGATARAVSGAVVMLDSRGLVFQGRDQIDADKLPFALPVADLARYGFDPATRYDLETVVRQVAPTILIGTSGTHGAFTEAAIKEMAQRTATPVVFPLSNPTSKSEATPADLLNWSQGRALVATGSPFGPVDVAGQARQIGQANNVYIFPGVGLGAIAARAREVTDGMFLAAATTLAGLVPQERLAVGALYPQLADLKQVTRAIAVAVASTARAAGVAGLSDTEDIAAAVDAATWVPAYDELG